jgi:signal transduction histidine kinase/AmiR/NasT family two-component response regulator
MSRILVIDDQKIPRVRLADILGEAGHEVVAEASGAAGIERARSWGPDVIVLDVNMPEMDGFAVVEQLKQDLETAAIPVVFLTATAADDSLIVRGLDLGAYDFISKGSSRAELLARVGVMARIKRSNDELSAIARISDTLIRTLDPAELSHHFLVQTREVFRAEAALLRLPGGAEHPALHVALGIDPGEPLVERFLEALDQALAEKGLESDVVALAELRGPAGALARQAGLRSAIVTRVVYDDAPPGLLAVLSRREHGFRRDSDAPLLELLVRQLSIAMDNALLHVRTREQAEALERAISERSRFFASMSHELRTPINALIGYNQLLETGTYGDLSEAQLAAIAKVGRSARHLLELINDILDISKIEAGKLEVAPEPTDVGALLYDTATSVELQAAEKGLDFRIEAPRSLQVVTDPARVRQIVLNLLSNAVKFTDQGSVRVEAAGHEDGGLVEIRVVDTGPGVGEADRARIFEEFEQVEGSAARGGTGLGLAISRKLAGLLGGELYLESELGAGSTFILRLPRAARAEASMPARSTADHAG